MTDTQRLLADYVRNGSERAFRELVTRYLDRFIQRRFGWLAATPIWRKTSPRWSSSISLGKRARFPSDVMLGGWLHRDTCFVASKIVRGERRRQFRESQAVEMNALQDLSTASNLAEVAPILDDAINQLGDRRPHCHPCCASSSNATCTPSAKRSAAQKTPPGYALPVPWKNFAPS